MRTGNPLESGEASERGARARAAVQVAANERDIHAPEGDRELFADRVAALREAVELNAAARCHQLHLRLRLGLVRIAAARRLYSSRHRRRRRRVDIGVLRRGEEHEIEATDHRAVVQPRRVRILLLSVCADVNVSASRLLRLRLSSQMRHAAPDDQIVDVRGVEEALGDEPVAAAHRPELTAGAGERHGADESGQSRHLLRVVRVRRGLHELIRIPARSGPSVLSL